MPSTPQMNKEQLKKFLSEKHLMDIATITPDGFPHVTPVWFDYDGEYLYVSTTKQRKKARNLLKNNKVGFSIAEHNPPYGAIVGYGTAQITEDTNGELLRKLAHKYLPQEKADKYAQELMQSGGARIILKIKPIWTLSWTGE